MDFILIYITNPTKKEANKIAVSLLNKKLIACGNIFPTESIYHWKGKVINKKEFVLIVKAKESYFKKIKEEVEKIHSYEIPCIIKIQAAGNKKYYKWLIEQYGHNRG
jgi:periplasmic divalent cation tolerance protein